MAHPGRKGSQRLPAWGKTRWLMGFFLFFLLSSGVSPAEAQRAGFLLKVEDPELKCLALNVFWESGGESKRGQEAVAHVTLNRVAAKGFPDTICKVVHQGGEGRRFGCQFHWWCDGRSDIPRSEDRWLQCLTVARRVLAGRHADPTQGALYYHAVYVKPSWARKRQVTARIGKHIFYR